MGLRVSLNAKPQTLNPNPGLAGSESGMGGQGLLFWRHAWVKGFVVQGGELRTKKGHETYCRMTAPVDWLAVKELEIRY